MAKQTFTTGQVLTAAQQNALQANDYNQTVSTKTANYVLVAADLGTRVYMNAAGATTITVNTGIFAAGDTLFLGNIGAGDCVVTAGTATVSKFSTASLTLSQYQGAYLYFVSTGVAILYSDSAGAAGPSFVGCSLFKSADQTLTNATQTIITFDSEEFDTDAFHSTVTNTGRITIPTGKGGKYLIVAGVTQQWGTGDKRIFFDLNGAALGALSTLPSPTVSYDWANTVSRVLSLVATDYVEVKTFQDSGGTKAIRGNAGALQYLTYFQAIYLGA